MIVTAMIVTALGLGKLPDPAPPLVMPGLAYGADPWGVDPLMAASVVLGLAGVLLGLLEFRRRERLLTRLRPWSRQAATLAAMGEEYLTQAPRLSYRGDEAHRTVTEMADLARRLAAELEAIAVEAQTGQAPAVSQTATQTPEAPQRPSPTGSATRS